MSTLDDKINEHFSGFVVRKDLVKTVKGMPLFPPMCSNTCSANIVPPTTRPRLQQASRRSRTSCANITSIVRKRGWSVDDQGAQPLQGYRSGQRGAE